MCWMLEQRLTYHKCKIPLWRNHALRSVLLPVAALLCGCATKYPQNEASSTFTYPLQDCTNTRLTAAASEASRMDRPVLASQATLCVTRTGPALAGDVSACLQRKSTS